MPIDPATLVKSLAPLTDSDPVADLASTLDLVVVAANQLFGVDAVGTMSPDADGRLLGPAHPTRSPRPWRTTRKPSPPAPAWTPSPAASQRSCTTPPWSRAGSGHPGLCGAADPLGPERPDPAGRRPDRDLDVYAAAPGLGCNPGQRPADLCRLAATLLGTAAKAEPSGRLAEQLKVALDARHQHQEAKLALTDRARPDDQQALIDLRPTTRSSRPQQPTTMADGTVAHLPLPGGQAEPAAKADGQLPRQDIEALDNETANRREQDPGGDWIGQKLRQLLLGFLATEVVPLANSWPGSASTRPHCLPPPAASSGCTPTPWTALTLASDSSNTKRPDRAGRDALDSPAAEAGAELTVRQLARGLLLRRGQPEEGRRVGRFLTARRSGRRCWGWCTRSGLLPGRHPPTRGRAERQSAACPPWPDLGGTS